jgi:hypothetical protein
MSKNENPTSKTVNTLMADTTPELAKALSHTKLKKLF